MTCFLHTQFSKLEMAIPSSGTSKFLCDMTRARIS